MARNDTDGGDVLTRPPDVDKETKDKSRTRRPPLYRVILVNDDFTPFEVVTHICATVFKIKAELAFHIMWSAHKNGSSVVACYAKDIAETKANLAMSMGSSMGWPLRFDVEPDGKEEDGD